jgi:hypothetical protein
MTKIRTALIGTAVLAILMASSSAGFAQGTPAQGAPAEGTSEGTPEQRAACMGDVYKFCSAEIPSVPKVTACMTANAAKLSPACKATGPKS